ncbi:MAG: sugar transferase, partial [Bacteroidota bacterium]
MPNQNAVDVLPFPVQDELEGGSRRADFPEVNWLRMSAAVLLAIPVVPLLSFLCVAVKASSRGAAIYRQVRLGRGGRPFTMLKLRSMRHDAEAGTGAVWATVGDCRTTRLGRFLRWSHLDELPQLVNILRGEMAFVGPRPERPEFVEKLAAEIPHYRDRLAVLPGVTGLAQVNLPPDDSTESVRKKLVFDRYYIEHRSLGMDLRVLAATALRLLSIR